MSGHLGITKPESFYWPGLKADVSNYCRSCHTCQVVPKAGLHPIPAFDEPFRRIIIDYVGPLPKPNLVINTSSLLCVLRHVFLKQPLSGILKLRPL